MSRFYFAWVTEGAAFVAREDEDVFALEMTHVEGEFPALRIDVRNPRVGLLAPGRARWCWLSWEPDGGAPEPLFHGRLIGVPEDLHDEMVRLMFLAKPPDYEDQKETLAAAMRVAPFWDPVWYNEEARADPDTVLEARPALWHIDRVTHEVSASNVIDGEAGTLIFGEDDFFYDGIGVTFGQAPVRRVEMILQANWTQRAAGSVDVTPAIVQAFRDAGSKDKPSSFTGDGLESDWPKPQTRIGGGWRVSDISTIARVDGIWEPTQFITVEFNKPKEPEPKDGDGAPLPESWGSGPTWSYVNPALMVGDAEGDLPVYVAKFPLWTFHVELVVSYEAARTRSELFKFALEADVQPITSEPGEEEVLRLNLSSGDLSEDIDDEVPIEDPRRRAYFVTDRGRRSLENGIAIARSRLLMRARAVHVRFDTRWETALALSCRHNAMLWDSRLPGGVLAGKVIAYTLACDGDTGALSAGVTLGCTVGRGDLVAPRPGEPAYVEDAYVEPGWQVRLEHDVMPIAGEVTYAQDYLQTEPVDDGVDFFDMRPETVLAQAEVVGGESAQRAAIASVPEMVDPTESLGEVYTEVILDFVPVTGGPFETIYTTQLSKLMVPKTIDLEAANAPVA